MLIKNHSERIKINIVKQNKILTFLKQQTYTNTKTLSRILTVNKHCTLKLLRKMEVQSLIIRYNYKSYDNRIHTLWGITGNGHAIADEGEEYLLPNFEPSRVRLQTLEHHLINQEVQLTLQEKGATQWINGDRNTFFKLYPDVKHRPDGVITLPNGKKSAIEVELNLKSKSRYKDIMKSHLHARSKPHWHFVYYIVSEPTHKKRLNMIFSSFNTLVFDGRPYPIEQKHRDVFKIFTREEFENIDLSTLG